MQGERLENPEQLLVNEDADNNHIEGYSFYDGAVTDFTRTEQVCWGAIQTVIMAVLSETFVELTCPEKSLAAAITLAVVVPLSIEWIKFAFNLSGALKHDFDFSYRANFFQIAILFVLAIILYEETLASKNFTTIGYNSVMILSGIGLKLINHYLTASAAPSRTTSTDLRNTTADNIEFEHSAENVETPLLFSNQAPTHAGQWYNSIAMHGLARLPLLFCATNAGGQFFEAMRIPLAEALAACGLKNFGAVVAFSVLLNEIIGSHLLTYSGKFKEAYPNLVSRCITMFGLGIGLQAANILKEVALGNFTAAFAIGFFTDLIVQESGLGNKIDQTARQAIAFFKEKGCKCLPEANTDYVPVHGNSV